MPDFFARLALIFADSIMQDTQSIISRLMRLVFQGPSYLKETALKEIAKLFLSERQIVNNYEMKEAEKILRDVITREEWIELLKETL